MIRLLRAAAFALLFYPGTLLFVLGCFAANIFGSKALRAVVRGWANFHHGLIRLLGTRVKVSGTVPRGAYLIAVKHQSMLETVEMLRIADMPVIVIKRELSEMPLFGWTTRSYGIIPVDRDAGSKALREMMALGKQVAAGGRAIVIYPEGTRVASGETPPLRAGFAGLYRALGLPVVPVAVDSGRTWGRNLPRRSGTVHFAVGEIIPPGLKRGEVEAQVHAAINALERSAP